MAPLRSTSTTPAETPAPDAFAAWLDAFTRSLDLLESPVGAVVPPPASASADQRAAALLSLCKRVGIDPASSKPWEGVSAKFHHLQGFHGNAFADRIANVLLAAAVQALRDGGNDANDPVLFPEVMPGVFLFESRHHRVADAVVLTPAGEPTPPQTYSPWRQVQARWDRLPAGLQKHIPRDEAFLNEDAVRVLCLGRPRQVFSLERGVQYVPALWVRLADALTWTKQAERNRLDAVAERERREREDLAERRRRWEASPEGKIAALEARVKELEGQQAR